MAGPTLQWLVVMVRNASVRVGAAKNIYGQKDKKKFALTMSVISNSNCYFIASSEILLCINVRMRILL